MERNHNSVDAFFNNLASFDTETTGINTKSSRIWQLGFTGNKKDIEEVVNPLLDCLWCWGMVKIPYSLWFGKCGLCYFRIKRSHT